MVEDDERDAELTSIAIGLSGFDVEMFQARNGIEALALIQAGVATTAGVELVLLDIHLPGLDGIELLRRIRKATATRALPVIIATGSNDPTHVQVARELGIEDVIFKGNFSEFCARIRRELRAIIHRKQAPQAGP